jgi:hypothetical protein
MLILFYTTFQLTFLNNKKKIKNILKKYIYIFF